MEKWKKLDNLGFKNYKISDRGRVFSEISNKILKPIKCKDGYLRVNLYINKKPQKKLIHLLVAESFISPKKDNLQVNHMDGNKLNNDLSNLEWVTPSENSLHAIRTGLVNLQTRKDTKGINRNHPKLSKNVLQIEKDKTIASYPSTREASRITGISQSDISRTALGERKTAGGYGWKYK